MGKITKIIPETHHGFLNLYKLETLKKTGKPGTYYLASRSTETDGLKLVSKENHECRNRNLRPQTDDDRQDNRFPRKP